MSSLVSYGQLRPAFIGALGVIFNRLLSPGSPVKLKRVEELIEFSDSGIWGRDSVDPLSDFRVFRVSDFKGDFRLNFSSPPYRSIPKRQQEKFRLRNGDILVVKSSGSAKQVVSGRVAVFEGNNDTSYAASNFLLRLRPSADVDSHYLAYALGSPPIRETIADTVKTMTYPNLSFKLYRSLTVPVIPLPDQRRVAEFLRAFFERRDLPDLPNYLKEQRRIVARIEELAAKIEAALALRKQASEATEALLGITTASLLRDPKWPLQSMEELVGRTNLKNGISLKSTDSRSGVRCLRISSMRKGRIDCVDSKPVPMSITQSEPYSVRRGDVFVVRGNGSKELVGRAGQVDQDCRGLIFPDLFIRVPLNPTVLLGSFFVAVWNSAYTREIIQEYAKTTSGIWKINQGHISSISIPIPPLPEQRRIVAYLDDLQAKADTVRGLQDESEVELNALMPSILSRAFSGDL